jgi:hypothetical protein
MADVLAIAPQIGYIACVCSRPGVWDKGDERGRRLPQAETQMSPLVFKRVVPDGSL